MRLASRRDANEPAIVRRLRAHGFLWLPNSAKGRPDGCALRKGTFWCEVKQPGESFTPEQVETFSEMLRAGVFVYVLETAEDVDDFAAGALPPWTGEGITVRDAKKTHHGKREHIPGKSRFRTVQEGCVEEGCAISKAPGSRYCTAHGKVDAVPPPRVRPTCERGDCSRKKAPGYDHCEAHKK